MLARRRFFDTSRSAPPAGLYYKVSFALYQVSFQCRRALQPTPRQARGPAGHNPYMMMMSSGFEPQQPLPDDFQRRALLGHSVKPPRPFSADEVAAKIQVSK